MPILQPESGLSEGDYAALAAARQHASYQLTAHQWDLDFTALAAGSGTGSGFDAVLFDGQPYRLNGTLLETTSGASWAAVAGFSPVASHNAAIPGSLVVEATSLYVFQCAGTGSSVTVSVNGFDGSSWSGWTQIDATGRSIRRIAATRSDRVHLVLDGGSLVEQDLLWPFPVESFDAAALGSLDVLLLTSMTPGAVQSRVVNLTVVKTIVPAGGVVGFTYQNQTYSDHIEVDVVDEWQPWRYRKHVTVTAIDDTLYALAYSSDGTRLAQILGHRLYTSKDGRNWSRGELITLAGAAAQAARLLRDASGTAYALQATKGFSAPSTLALGLSAASMQLDLTPYLLRAQFGFSGMLQAGLELDNEDGRFDASLLDQTHTVALVWQEGYDGALVQTALLEVDSFERFEGVESGQYKRVLRLTARDRLSWMSDKTQSEQFLYRDPIVIGADDYQDDTQSGYGGLAHTATWEGSWKTANNQLILWSNNEEAQTASTHKIDLWNFDVQVSFHLSQVANDEFAGFHFRSADHKNGWRAYFDQATDKIRVDHRVDDVDTNVATSASALGWAASPATSRHLRLRAYYGKVYVYISADGITWGTPHLTIDFPGQAQLPATQDGVYPTYRQQAGYVGLIGQGYNPDEEWTFNFEFLYSLAWLWEDSLMDGATLPAEASGDRTYETVRVVLAGDGFGAQLSEISVDDGTVLSTTAYTGLDVGGTDFLDMHLIEDPREAGTLWALNSYGLYKNANGATPGSAFSQVASAAEILGSAFVVDVGNPDATSAAASFLLMDRAKAGWILCVFGEVACVTFNSGLSWSQSRINARLGAWSLAQLAEGIVGSGFTSLTYNRSANLSTGYNLLASGRLYAISQVYLHATTEIKIDLMVSTDWGLSWSQLQTWDDETGRSDDTFEIEVYVPRYKLVSRAQNDPIGAQEVWLARTRSRTNVFHGSLPEARTVIYKSTDSGASFTEVADLKNLAASSYDEHFPGGRGRSFGVAGLGQTAKIYFQSYAPSGAMSYLFSSTDGASWTQQGGVGPDGSTDGVLIHTHPNNSNYLIRARRWDSALPMVHVNFNGGAPADWHGVGFPGTTFFVGEAIFLREA